MVFFQICGCCNQTIATECWAAKQFRRDAAATEKQQQKQAASSHHHHHHQKTETQRSKEPGSRNSKRDLPLLNERFRDTIMYEEEMYIQNIGIYLTKWWNSPRTKIILKHL